MSDFATNILQQIHSHAVTRTIGTCQLHEGHLNYTIHGNVNNTKRIFCVMGFTTDGHQYYNTVDHFTAQNYTVLTFDNRGNGRSSDPLSIFDLTIYTMALEALALLDSIGWQSTTTHLIGTSMGGMIGLEMLAKRTFLSAALIVTTGSSAAWFPIRGILHMVRTIFDPTLSTHDRAMLAMEQNFNRDWLHTDSGTTHPTTGEAMTNEKRITRIGAKLWWAKKNDGIKPDPSLVGTFAQLIACVKHGVSNKKLNRIRMNHQGRILLVGAKHDKMVRVNGSHELKEMLVPFEFIVLDSGHAVNIQCNEEVNAAIERLFDKVQEDADGVDLVKRSKL